MEVSNIGRGEKLVWLWAIGRSDIALSSKVGARLVPPAFERVWSWVFEIDPGSGDYRRATRALEALRNRARSYRRFGVKSELCANLALFELYEALGASKPSATKIPARRTK